MSAAIKCDHCGSTTAESPYPMTLQDSLGATADYCSAPCVVLAVSEMEQNRAYADGWRFAARRAEAPKRRWFR